MSRWNARRARWRRRVQPFDSASARASETASSSAVSRASARSRSRSVGAASIGQVSSESARRTVARSTSSGRNGAAASCQNGLSSSGEPSSVAACRTRIEPPGRTRAGGVEEVAVAADRVGPLEPRAELAPALVVEKRRASPPPRQRALLEPEDEHGVEPARPRARAGRARRPAPARPSGRRAARAGRGRRSPRSARAAPRVPRAGQLVEQIARGAATRAGRGGPGRRPAAPRARRRNAPSPRARRGCPRAASGVAKVAQRDERRLAQALGLLLDARRRVDRAAAQPPFDEVDARRARSRSTACAGTHRARGGRRRPRRSAAATTSACPSGVSASFVRASIAYGIPKRAHHGLERRRASARPTGRRSRSARARPAAKQREHLVGRRARASRGAPAPARKRTAPPIGRCSAPGSKSERSRWASAGRDELVRARRQLLDPAAGERREVVGGTRERGERGAARLVGERDLDLGAARRAPRAATIRRRSGPRTRRRTPARRSRHRGRSRVVRRRAGEAARDPRARAGRARRGRRRRAQRGRRRDRAGSSRPPSRSESAASSESANPENLAEPRAAFRAERGGDGAAGDERALGPLATGRAPGSPAAIRSNRSSNVPIVPPSRQPLQLEQLALDPGDVRPVRHDQKRLVVETSQIALEQERDLARVRGTGDQAQTALSVVGGAWFGAGSREVTAHRSFAPRRSRRAKSPQFTLGAGFRRLRASRGTNRPRSPLPQPYVRPQTATAQAAAADLGLRPRLAAARPG